MLKAPFPYFGGKSKVAKIVWQALGDPQHFIEPFAGSLAVLLGRPTPPKTETVNDLDCYISNFWRALAADPEQVAFHADYPVNECDLTARHLWLVNEGKTSLKKLWADADYYDAKVAGWWVWGLSAWIGSGWCTGKGPWSKGEDGTLTKTKEQEGVKNKLPHCGKSNKGINALKRKMPHLASGKGINRKRMNLGGEHGNMPGVLRNQDLYEYMFALADRLHRVRVCCGDWSRVVTEGALSHGDHCGIFLDPPYSTHVRDKDIYTHDVDGLALAVRNWAVENGDSTRYRIALCGYEGEFDMPDTWRVHAWKAGASYKTLKGDTTRNRFKERIWFSPHCLRPDQGELL